MATLTEDQLQTLITALTANTAPQHPPPQQPPPQAQVVNDASALGPMPPCILGANKMTRLQQFETWLEEAENRMKYLSVTDDTKKVILLRSWGGADLVKFMKSHAKVAFEAIPATDTTAAIQADTYKNVIDKIR